MNTDKSALDSRGKKPRQRKSGLMGINIPFPDGWRENLNNRGTIANHVSQRPSVNGQDGVVPDGFKTSGRVNQRGTVAVGRNGRATGGLGGLREVESAPDLVAAGRRHTLPATVRGPPDSAAGKKALHLTFPVGHADWGSARARHRRAERYTLRWEVDRAGRGPGQLRNPSDLCFIDSENLLVTESKNSR